MQDNVICWKCGESLATLLRPFSRNEECIACKADVHVCKMCGFYDTRSNNSCREPVAERVNDKERSNFCDYFNVKSAAYENKDVAAEKKARANLEALFGGNDESNDALDSLSGAGKAKIELEKLFGTEDKEK